MLTFDEETHTYYLDGQVVPSVTQILQEVFPDKYKGVPKTTLERKATYGSQVHKFIEIIETKKPKKPLAYIKRYYKPSIYQIASLEQYLEMKKKYKIEVLESEKMIHYKNLYAGTLDMIARIDGKLALIDIKTTAELDKTYVSYQTSLYEMGCKNGSYTVEFDKLMCWWLPKGHLGKLVEVDRIDRGLLKQLVRGE